MNDQNLTVDDEMRLRRYGRCYDCKQPKTGGALWRYWCRTCYNKRFQDDFSSWTSGNEIIDKFIQKKQLDVSDYVDVIEWIPFDRFKDVESLVDEEQPEPFLKAIWIDGYIEKWKNFKWVRPSRNVECCLKKLYLSDSSTENEIEDQFKLHKIKIYGITKDPKRSDYMLVIDSRNLCKKCLQLKARSRLEHWETWCNPCNSKYFQGEFKNWTSGNGIIDKFIQRTQIEASIYYEVVEWIPFERFNNIQVFEGESGSVLVATWIDGPIRSWDYENNKWSRILVNEKFCLRSLESISNFPEIENQYKIRKTKRNFTTSIAILGITKDPEKNDYMVVMLYQDMCNKCLWPTTEKDWCNPCNARFFQNEFKNWTSGNETIDKFIQEKQITALNSNDVVRWFPFEEFKNIELIEGEFGSALKASVTNWNIIFDDEGIYEEWIREVKEWYRQTVHLKRFNSSNISHEFLQEIVNQESLNHFRKFGENLITVYGITKDPEKDDYMIVMEYDEKKICYKCLLPNTGDNWCNKCNSKHFQDKFKDWSSGNELIDEFIKRKQLNALSMREIIEWIPFDKLRNPEKIGQGGFGTAFKATWTDGFIESWDYKENEWKRYKRNSKEVCLKRLDKSHTISQEFLREVETQINAQRYGNTIPIYGITKDPKHNDYMIVMDYAKEGSLREMLNKHHSELSWRDKLQNVNFIAYALAGIHEANLIHKDLHSGNIVMTDIYNSWITDFGLCKPVTANHEKDIYGVISYTAPEILCGGGKPTEASDVYSFGVIMGEFLTGYPPYHDVAHDRDLASRICQGSKPFSPEVRRGVPQLLLDLMDRCLHIDPLERQSAGEVQNSVYYYLINCDKKFTDIGKQIEAIENSNISYPKYDPANCIKHPKTCYTSRRLDYKDLHKVYAVSLKRECVIPDNFTFDDEIENEN